jgi:lipopolysaccharide/colanic/teichoic acid biosynthesis glycosyltransferase
VITRSWYTAFGKRALDLLLAVPLLLTMAPLLLVTLALVRWHLGNPALFRQLRPGIHGRIFRLYKIRTMTDARNVDGMLLPDTERLTRLGRWIRSTSLDELPQLWNVVRGDMSLIGPRPLLPEYLPRYSTTQARRHDVRPGITGWAQINGRNQITWPERLAADAWYVDHCSWHLDLRILCRTAVNVLRRQGVAAQGHDTMPHFTGGS